MKIEKYWLCRVTEWSLVLALSNKYLPKFISCLLNGIILFLVILLISYMDWITLYPRVQIWSHSCKTNVFADIPVWLFFPARFFNIFFSFCVWMLREWSFLWRNYPILYPGLKRGVGRRKRVIHHILCLSLGVEPILQLQALRILCKNSKNFSFRIYSNKPLS